MKPDKGAIRTGERRLAATLVHPIRVFFTRLETLPEQAFGDDLATLREGEIGRQ
jgi:hypothetical protein